MKKQSKITKRKDNLELLQINSEIFCHHCGHKNYQRRGRERKTQKYKYFCKNCNRWFVEKKTSTSHLPLGEDIWHANKLGLRVAKHKDSSKIAFVNIQQEWLKEAAKKYSGLQSNRRQ